MDWAILTSAQTTAGSIANWANNTTITSGPGGVADTILQEACSWIYRRLRHWRMLTTPVLSSTLTIGSDVVPVPADMLEPGDFWYLNNNTPYFLTQKDPVQVYMAWQFDGNGNRIQQPPTIYSFGGGNNGPSFTTNPQFRLDSPADQAYVYYLTYWQQPTPLSQSNTQNFLTTFYQRLLRLTCMAGAVEWLKDNGQGNFDRTYWDQLAEEEIYRVQAESDRARRGTINSAQLIGGGDYGYPMYSLR